MIKIHDKMIPKYPKINIFGHKDTMEMFNKSSDILTITEKIDGANGRCGFISDDGNIYMVIGSHNRVIYVKDIIQDKIIFDVSQKPFKRSIEYLENIEDELFAVMKDSNILYFENLIPHKIRDYKFDELPPLIVFEVYDIYNQTRNNFYIINDVNELLDKSHNNTNKLEKVNVIENITVGSFKRKYGDKNRRLKNIDSIKEKLIPKSVYCDNERLAEGVIISNERLGMKCKLVSNKFREKYYNKGDNKYSQKDRRRHKMTNNFEVEEFMNYANDNRIEKKIYELRDERYGSICMQMMQELPTIVINDILEESDIEEEVFNINKKIISKRIYTKCVIMLKKLR